MEANDTSLDWGMLVIMDAFGRRACFGAVQLCDSTVAFQKRQAPSDGHPPLPFLKDKDLDQHVAPKHHFKKILC